MTAILLQCAPCSLSLTTDSGADCSHYSYLKLLPALESLDLSPYSATVFMSMRVDAPPASLPSLQRLRVGCSNETLRVVPFFNAVVHSASFL